MTTSPVYQYHGPQCPYCDVTLPEESLRTGEVTCASCNKTFEATAFTPVDRRARILELAVSGPEGATACANHARNAAVTSCERCGLFICGLCEMNVGEGSFCPSCFERARAEGTMQSVSMKRRDYATMARATLVFGFLFMIPFGLIAGPLAAVYAIRGKRQRREDGESTISTNIVMVLAILLTILAATLIGFFIVGMVSS
jgi:hypothetical protein